MTATTVAADAAETSVDALVAAPAVVADVVAALLAHSDVRVALRVAVVSRSGRNAMSTKQCRHPMSSAAYVCPMAAAPRCDWLAVHRCLTSLTRSALTHRHSFRHCSTSVKW